MVLLLCKAHSTRLYTVERFSMVIPFGKLAWLCFVWAALLLLGLSMGANLPFILAVIGTVLYLVF